MNITEANATISILEHAGLLDERDPHRIRPPERIEADLALLCQRASKALGVTVRPRFAGLGAELVAGEVGEVDHLIAAQAANELLDSCHEVIARAVTALQDTIIDVRTEDLDLMVAAVVTAVDARFLVDTYRNLRVLRDELHEHAEGAL